MVESTNERSEPYGGKDAERGQEEEHIQWVHPRDKDYGNVWLLEGCLQGRACTRHIRQVLPSEPGGSEDFFPPLSLHWGAQPKFSGGCESLPQSHDGSW